MIKSIVRWADDRVGASGLARSVLNKVFPDHWSFMLGEIAMYSFVILVLSGAYLTFFFEPSQDVVVYQGSYEPLQGVSVSRAYESVVDLSFDVRGGLVMRQLHHWTALLFVGAILLHMLRIFFTGAFRRPRELNWMMGLTLLVLAMSAGFTGYSLPDDLLSGTGLRIMYSMMLSIPVAGEWLAFLIFNGEFPSESIISRLFALHIFIIPATIAAVMTVHLLLVFRQMHTQYPGPKRTEKNVVGLRLWPTFTAKTLGLFFFVFGLVAAFGGLVQINPVWLYGPYEAADVSAGSQPDWYIGWLEGALRLMPNWEIRAFGFTVPNPFFPGILLPGIIFTLLYLWPFLEQRVTKDRAEHNILDRPRERAWRTAIGVAGLTFMIVLFVAGSNDIIAVRMQMSINAITNTLRVLLFVLPIVTGFVTFRVCRELVAREQAGEPSVVHLRRNAEGGYVEIEEPAAEASEAREPAGASGGGGGGGG